MSTLQTYCVRDVHGRPCQFLAGHHGDCRPIAMEAWQPLPSAEANLVTENLFIGGEQATVDPSLYDVVVSMHSSLSRAPAPILERRMHFQDGTMPDVDELLACVGFVFYHWVLQGKRVLVRDRSGLNRSGLVVAHTLITNCVEPNEAIAMVRRARSPYALSNPRYLDYLLSLGTVNDLF